MCEPGEMVIVGPEGIDARTLRAGSRSRALRLRTRVFFASGFDRLRPAGAGIARECWADCWRGSIRWMPMWWCRCPIRASPPRIGYAAEAEHSVPPGADSQSLRGPHVHRTFAGDSRFRREAEAEPGAASAGRQARDSGGRFDRARDHVRKIVRMVRGAGAREVHLRISCPPTVSPCFYGVDTPSLGELIAANNTVEEIRRFVEADSLGYLSLGGLREAVADNRSRLLLRLLHRQLSDGTGEYRAS